MKKILPILLVIMLSLTACGEQETIKTKEELKAEILAELKAETETNGNAEAKPEDQSEINKNDDKQANNATPEYLSNHKVIDYNISDNELYIKMGGTYENIEGKIFLSELSGDFEFVMDNKYKENMESITYTDEETGAVYKITPPGGPIYIPEGYISSVFGDDIVERIMTGEEVKVTCNISEYSQTLRFESEYWADADVEIVDFEKLANDNTNKNSGSPEYIDGHRVLEYELTDDTFYLKLDGEYEGLVGYVMYDDYYESYTLEVSILPGMVSHDFTLGGYSNTIIPPTGTFLLDTNYLKSVISDDAMTYIKSGNQIKVDCNISDYTYSAKLESGYGTSGNVEIFDYELPAN